MYGTQRTDQGQLKRYVVLLRVNADLDLSPSADTYTTHVVWADEPYDAMTTAIILAKQQRGYLLRRVVGVEEWPIEAKAVEP